MEYIKIPIICADAILALGEAECGRLLMSLLEYSRGGGTVEPRGAEKSIYLILKAQMDKDTETGRKRAENSDLDTLNVIQFNHIFPKWCSKRALNTT